MPVLRWSTKTRLGALTLTVNFDLEKGKILIKSLPH